ncbi:iron-containing alcohol dehydrogenase [Desulforhopalus sp. 52FAK]
MLNFNFYNPTQIAFGKGQLEQLDALVPKDAKILITYGGGSAKKTGVLDRVQNELAKSDREVLEFGGIGANPQFSVLMQAVEIVRKEKVDFLLAVGGGSVMDGTKFIAIAANANEYIGKERELLKFGFTPVPVENVVPLATVLTLPATGSEMNNGAVISDGEDKLPVFSPHTFPKFSILDPELTYTLPSTQITNGVVDTFVHTLEQYITYPAEARFQDRTAEGILHTLIEIGQQTIENPEDYDARANLVWCATMALNGLIGAGVPQDWTTHMIGHEITALFGVDHAKSLAVIQPAVWKVRKKQKRAKLLQYGERVWGIVEGSEEERLDATIAKTEEFFQSLGMKTRLADHNIDAGGIDKILKSLEKHGMTALSETQDITLETSKEILEAAL